MIDKVGDADACRGDMLLLLETVNETVGLTVAVAVAVGDTLSVFEAVALAEFDKDIGLIDTVPDNDDEAVGVLDELAELPRDGENERDIVPDLEAVILAV